MRTILLCPGRVRGQVDAKGGPDAGSAVHLDAAVMSAHDAERRGESETASRELGGEKRVENARHDGVVDSRPGVLHFEEDEAAGVRAVGAEEGAEVRLIEVDGARDDPNAASLRSDGL